MQSLLSLANRAGFRLNDGASGEAFAELESALGVELPDEFRELWSSSDGMSGIGIDLVPLAVIGNYAGLFPAAIGYVPFSDCNDSDPYAICCNGPARGLIAHIFHDGDDPHLVCRGLRRFLELVAETRDGGGDVDRIAGDFDFDRPERDERDVETARSLVRAAEPLGQHDPSRVDLLRYAAQLFGPGQEDELATVMSRGNEYVREIVLRRLRGIGTPAATERIRADAAAYRQFIGEFRTAFEAVGTKTQSSGQHEFVLMPGNVGLNFAMIYADCRRPGAMAEWVERFRSRR